MREIRTSLLFALATVIATVGAVWFSGRTVAPKETTWQDILAEAKAGDYRIIATEELAGRYRKNASDLLLVDTRQEWEYRTGHIEGAVNFPMKPTWWERWRKAGDLNALLGPDKQRGIVFY